MYGFVTNNLVDELNLAPNSPPLSEKTIAKFLGWKEDNKRAAERIKSHAKWRKTKGSDFNLDLHSNDEVRKCLASAFII